MFILTREVSRNNSRCFSMIWHTFSRAVRQLFAMDSAEKGPRVTCATQPPCLASCNTNAAFFPLTSIFVRISYAVLVSCQNKTKSIFRFDSLFSHTYTKKIYFSSPHLPFYKATWLSGAYMYVPCRIALIHTVSLPHNMARVEVPAAVFEHSLSLLPSLCRKVIEDQGPIIGTRCWCWIIIYLQLFVSVSIWNYGIITYSAVHQATLAHWIYNIITAKWISNTFKFSLIILLFYRFCWRTIPCLKCLVINLDHIGDGHSLGLHLRSLGSLDLHIADGHGSGIRLCPLGHGLSLRLHLCPLGDGYSWELHWALSGLKAPGSY